jgi:hypothetical protein
MLDWESAGAAAMHRVRILRTIPHDRVHIVLACDEQSRLLLGVAVVGGEPGHFAFAHIDSKTALELERGTLDLFTVLDERAVGPHFVAASDWVPDFPESRG